MTRWLVVFSLLWASLGRAPVYAAEAFFSPAPEPWTAALRGFASWSNSAAGRDALASVDPELSRLPLRGGAAALVAEPLLRAALERRGGPEAGADLLSRLARTPELSSDERAELASELAAARRAAGPDVLARLQRWSQAVAADAPEVQTPPGHGWQAALAFFGPEVRSSARTLSDELSRRKSERALALVRPFEAEALKGKLDAQDLAGAKAQLSRVHPVDLADHWDALAPAHRKIVIRLLPAHKAAQTFEELERAHQQELLDSLEHEHAGDLVRGLDPAAAGRLVRDLPPAALEKLMRVMQQSDREKIQLYAQYPEKSVGSLMRGRYVTVEPEWSARRALDAIRLSTRLRHVEQTHLETLIVVDREGRLQGTIPLKVLVAAPGSSKVGMLMEPSPRTLKPLDDRQEAVNLFTRYKLRSAPVVEADDKVAGLVLPRDVLGAATAEAEDDIARMAGGKPGLLSRSPLAITGVRLPWLIATCLGELAVSLVVKHYEPTLSHIVALATFIPLISAMGGNVGAQTATVVVRGLATGEVEREGAQKVVAKEIAVGLLLGAIYGAAIAAAAFGLYGGQYGWKFAGVVGFAMAVSMTAAATAGSLEPFLFKKLGIDPATATGPLITTFTDLVSTLVYFSTATLLLLAR